ncbi:uncharacterized protein LOC124370989 [Homalodisca vitripennis]|uniref:uncharacterized protein LOC124370989 n=1 Tax=Homalodisca vitripennis TaxID=197043 RepID=UPI001EEC90EF|nr:uncharacterized protein LOC124370989 [Homalodisca vitripennis]
MFRNYKQYFSIVLQGVAGPDYKFIAVDVGGYGKESDGGIFSHSYLSENLEKGALGSQSFAPLPGTNIKVPHVILGDEAYPLKTYLMRPFPGDNLDPAKRLFNRRLSKARQVIECTFGIISNKWRLLLKGIEVEPDFVDTIVQCICLLHNIVIDKEGEQQVFPHGQEDSNDDNTTSRPVRFTSLGENRGSTAAYTVRDNGRLASLWTLGVLACTSDRSHPDGMCSASVSTPVAAQELAPAVDAALPDSWLWDLSREAACLRLYRASVKTLEYASSGRPALVACTLRLRSSVHYLKGRSHMATN